MATDRLITPAADMKVHALRFEERANNVTRLELPGGVIREPIDPAELRRLYVRKNLPLD